METPEWCSRQNECKLIQSDAMSKADLAFSVEASMNLTKLRYDITAHADVIKGDEIVFSLEKGEHRKSRTEAIESLLLDTFLRWREEDIKIVVLDSASISKSWATCILLPQYIVDQGMV